LASGRPFGLTHLIEKLAWKDMSTRNRESVQAELDEIGAVVDCIVTKDFTIYAMTVARNNVELGLDILAEAVFQPELNNLTLDQAKGDLCFEVENMIDPTQQEQPLSDAIHSAAFGISPYAFPKLGDPQQIDYFQLFDVKSYLKTYYTPNNMTVAVSGLGPEDAENFKTWANEKITIRSMNSSFMDAEPITITGTETPVYQGGECSIHKTFNQEMSVTELPELVHFSLAYPSAGVENVKDHAAMDVIRALLGGGDSFSSGGPGKGMYARLYKDVLSQGIYWGCKSFHNPYPGTSLFGVNSSCQPQYVSLAIELVMSEFWKLRNHKVSEEQLSRAKNQLKMTTFLNLEQKPNQYEDLVRQLTYKGSWVSPDEWAKIVDDITPDDIKSVVDKYLTNEKVSFAAVGNSEDVPKYEHIVKAMDVNSKTPGKLPDEYRKKLMQWYYKTFTK